MTMTSNKILLVENDPNWTIIEKSLLDRYGYDVVTRQNAVQAIEFLNEIYRGGTIKDILDTADKGINLVMSDLHMGGDKLNGEFLLEHIIINNLPVKFVLVSGTISPNTKLELAEKIPFIYLLGKDDFYEDSSLIETNLSNIISEPPPNYSNKRIYVTYLRDFKNRQPAPDIRIHADRIKSKVIVMSEHYKDELGGLYDQLRQFNYYGSDYQEDKTTATQLHTLKNLIRGYAILQIPEQSELKRELSSIVDDISLVINAPFEDKLSLLEIVLRSMSNLETIYNHNFDISELPDVKIHNSRDFIYAFHLLLENAIQYSNEPHASVKIFYKNGDLYIENQGDFPKEFIDDNGHILTERIKSSSTYGSSFGIKNCIEILRRIGSDIRYELSNNTVRAVITLSTYIESSQTQNTKNRILVYDEHGSRFEYLKDAYNLGYFQKANIDFLSDKEKELSEIPLAEYDIALVHPGSNLTFFGVNVAKQNPLLRIYVVSGSFNRLQYSPTDNTNTYTLYRKLLEKAGCSDKQPLESAVFLEASPSLDTIKDIFSGKYNS